MRRSDALRDLSDDHHTALVLARRCRRAVRPGSELVLADVWRVVQEAFAHHLDPHFAIEERHLLPALEAIGESDLARRIRDDHEALRFLRCDGEASADRILRFGELLRDHVRYEERQVFDAVQDRLPEAALQAIAQACRELPRSHPASLDS